MRPNVVLLLIVFFSSASAWLQSDKGFERGVLVLLFVCFVQLIKIEENQ